MAKKVNTTIIGAFVIAAIGLLLASILIFSGGNFFKKRNRYVLFFDEKVSGLSIGSPVMFRGVAIGSVKSITLLADTKKLHIYIPIIIEVDTKNFKTMGERKFYEQGTLTALIEEGLRAKLDIMSLVTGQYNIELDFYPETEVRLLGIEPEYEEIPTIKSSLTEFSETFRDMPLRQVVENINEITKMIKEALANDSLDNLMKGLNGVVDHVGELVTDAERLVEDTDRDVTTISREVKEGMRKVVADMDAITSRTTLLLDNLNNEVGPVAKQIRMTLSAAQKTLHDASNTLETADQFISDSEVRFKLGNTLEEMATAARSIRELTDYLERHPESLIRGKRNLP